MRLVWGLIFLCVIWVGCSKPGCGDGIVDASSGEECDDGNNTNDDGCQVTCQFPGCGDGVLSLGEECDDGNNTNDDGCEGDCTFACQSPNDCSDDNACTTDVCVSNRCQFEALNPDDDNPCTIDSCDPASGTNHEPENNGVTCTQPGGELGFCLSASCEPVVCGDGFASTGEECDDGNNLNTDACTNVCQPARCGDGFVLSGTEVCDDGNLIDDDGCNSNCFLPILQLAAGANHTCVLLNDGSVRCWGRGIEGELGYGNTTSIGDNETPASAGNVNVGAPVIQLAAGDTHTCALLNNGSVRCWGNAGAGQLGYGNQNKIGDDETPASAGDVNVGAPVIQLASGAGSFHTCALLSTGAVRCWGFNGIGQLGYGNTTQIGDDETPASVGDVNVGGSVIQLAAGFSHTCALLDTGSVRCWGDGTEGQLGYGNTDAIGDDETPVSAGDTFIF